MSQPSLGQTLNEEEAMSLAILEAQRGFGYVSPNPPVGCVILDAQGRFLSSGFHAACGEDHAEVAALQQIKDLDSLKGAKVIVTLEPCSSEGRTPSCARALSRLPIDEVVFGIHDPNPRMEGGAQILEEAGISTRVFSGLQDELYELAEVFLWNQKFNQCFLTLKVASSLDGQIALASGESQWITGEEARQEAHRIRALHDAVLVGVGTFLMDDPKLTIRHPDFLGMKKRVVVLDPSGRGVDQIKGSQVYASHSPEQIIWVVANPKCTDALKDLGVSHLLLQPRHDGSLSWNEISSALFEAGILSLMVEGGAGVIGELLRQAHWQKLQLFMGPKILGAKSGLAWSKDFGTDTLSGAVKLSSPRTQNFGSSLLLTYKNPSMA